MFWRRHSIQIWRCTLPSENWRNQKIAHLQYKLLESAYHTCKVWGTIIYSTCTINPLENECNISQFLDMYQDSVCILPLHIAQCASWLVSNQYYPIDPQVSNNSIRCRPHLQYTGWFYIAMIQKTAWSSQTTSPKLSRHSRMPNTKRSPISKKHGLIYLPICWNNLDL